METELAKIPRKRNFHACSLETFASTCKLPFEPNHQFIAETKHRPTILENVNNWQVFDSDTHINNFSILKEEFCNTNMDTDTVGEVDQIDKIETKI